MLVMNDQIYMHGRRDSIDFSYGFASHSQLSESPVMLGTIEGVVTFDDLEFPITELGSGTIHFQTNEYLDHGFLFEQTGMVELWWLQSPKDWDSIHMVLSYRTGENEVINHEVVDWLREGF